MLEQIKAHFIVIFRIFCPSFFLRMEYRVGEKAATSHFNLSLEMVNQPTNEDDLDSIQETVHHLILRVCNHNFM